jgi:hypothetical protein
MADGLNCHLLIHCVSDFNINLNHDITFIHYPNGVKISEALRKTVLFVNKQEIELQNMFDVVLNLSDVNQVNLMKFVDIKKDTLKSQLNAIVNNPKQIYLPIKSFNKFNSLNELSDMIFIVNPAILKILVSSIRSVKELESNPGGLISFIAHRIGVPLLLSEL